MTLTENRDLHNLSYTEKNTEHLPRIRYTFRFYFVDIFIRPNYYKLQYKYLLIN
jgi:hypothetical protein